MNIQFFSPIWPMIWPSKMLLLFFLILMPKKKSCGMQKLYILSEFISNRLLEFVYSWCGKYTWFVALEVCWCVEVGAVSIEVVEDTTAPKKININICMLFSFSFNMTRGSPPSQGAVSGCEHSFMEKRKF